MVDPLSVGAIAATAITEGIKFLYGQADAILKRRAERKRAQQAGEPAPSEPIPVQTPDALEGRLAPLEVDDAAADKHAEVLKDLRHALEDYALGYSATPPGDDALRAALALRDAIEDVVGQRITFKGEQREPSGTPVVTGRVSAKEIRARATGADIEGDVEGRVEGEVEAGLIGEGADVAGVRVRGNVRGKGTGG